MISFLNNILKRAWVYGPANAASYLFHGTRLVLGRLGGRPLKRSVHGYQMWLDPSDPGISKNLMLNGDREKQLRLILERELHPGNVVLDLGANIGYYALMERDLIGPSGRIYALEPSPSNVALLRKNLALNGADTIEVFELAGGAERGRGTFYLAEHSNLNTFLPLDDGSKPVEVEIIDMSTFLADKQPIDLMRMDVEGYEVEVLAGLRAAIQSGAFRGKIVFECHFPKYDGS